MNWMSILGLCLIVLGTVFSFFGTVKSSDKGQSDLTMKIQEKNHAIDEIKADNVKLMEQNKSLLTTSHEVTNTNQNLYAQNKEMLQRIDSYQTDIEERNTKIENLQSEINDVKEYGYYATLNPYGVESMPGYGLKLSGDLYDRMDKILIQKNGQIYVRQDLSIMPTIDEVIKKYPKFPFGYWCKYQLLKMAGMAGWQSYAKKAIDIFKITTTIVGHNSAHDEGLKASENDLKSN